MKFLLWTVTTVFLTLVGCNITELPLEILHNIDRYLTLKESRLMKRTSRRMTSTFGANFGEFEEDDLHKALSSCNTDILVHMMRLIAKEECVNIVFVRMCEVGCLEAIKRWCDISKITPTVFNVAFEENAAFRRSIASGKVDVVEFLLKDSRINPNDGAYTPLFLAAVKGYAKIVEILLTDARLDLEVDGDDAIGAASEYGHVEVVKLLLEDGRCDPASNRNFPIRIAVIRGNLEVVKALLKDSRADVTESENEAICTAIESHTNEMVMYLLDNVRETRIDAFEAALKYHNVEIIMYILSNRYVDPSISDAIQIAAANGFYEC
jgi:hypothetical protein